MTFIGIDLGTTFIKGAVLNLKARGLEHTQRRPFPHRLETASPLQWEYDPNEIAAAARTLISDLALHAPDCEGIVMCSQMHGLVLTNNQGEAVSNCVSWRDQRVLEPHPSSPGSYFDEIARRVSPQQRRQLGHELEPGRPICVLFWLADQGKLNPGDTPVSMPDFVLGRLCNSAPAVEATNAGASGAFNLETLDWHYDVIKGLGLAHLNWPSLHKQGEVVGCLKLGAHWVPCFTPVGDYQCSLAGSLLGAEELSLNISTGSQISRLTAALSLGEYQTRPFFDQEFLNTFTNTPGGRSLNVLVDLLSELTAARNTNLHDPWTFIAQATKQIAETDLKVDLTFFPEPDRNRGMISNIRGDNFTVGHLFRAAFNDMAERYHTCALRLWPEKTWKNLVFSGGVACRLEVLRETIQKRFATGYRLAPFTEDALFGLLILGLVFSGEADSVKEATKELRSIYQTEGQNA
jgi:sugar (pentulose or hexulose) kinase